MINRSYKLLIEANSISVYSLDQSENHTTLAKVESFPLQNNFFAPQLSPVEIDSLKSELSLHLAKNYSAANSFDVLLSSLQTQDFLFKFPPMSEAELSEAIKFQAKKLLTDDFENLSIDLEIFEPSLENSDINVLLVASSPRVTERIVNIFSSLGAQVNNIESTTSALLRSLVSSQKSINKQIPSWEKNTLYFYFTPSCTHAILIDSSSSPLLLSIYPMGFDIFVSGVKARHPESTEGKIIEIFSSIGLEPSLLSQVQEQFNSLQAFVTNTTQSSKNLLPRKDLTICFLFACPKIKNLELLLGITPTIDANILQIWKSKLAVSPNTDIVQYLPIIGSIS